MRKLAWMCLSLVFASMALTGCRAEGEVDTRGSTVVSAPR